MRQQSPAAHARRRHHSTTPVFITAFLLPLLLACGLSDVFGKKATATVPAILLGTPVRTVLVATAGPATAQPAAPEAVAGQPTATPAATTAPGAPPATAGGQSTYTVVQGDTLSGIAQQFGLTTQELVAANSGIDPDALSIGQTIIIPGAGAAAENAPVAAPTQGQVSTTPGAQAAYAQAIQLEAFNDWLQSLVPLVTTFVTYPSTLCTSPELDATLQQGQGLQVTLGSVTPPAEMAALHQQLQDSLKSTSDGLVAAKAAMCEENDSGAAIASLLQVAVSLGQAQATLDSVSQSVP